MLRLRTPVAVLAIGSILALIVSACAAEPSDSDADDQAAAGAATVAEETAPTEPQATDSVTRDESEAAHGDDEDDHGEESESYAFGEPADPTEADRTITIEASDEMAFDPASVEVSAGEVVTFEVVNVGQLPHDFTLGDEETQQAHATEMAEMSGEMAHADPNAMTVSAGETATLTWRFEEGGEVLYGCHQPGHYDAGMVGTVIVGS